MQKSFIVRKYRIGDEFSINKLFEKVFSKTMSISESFNHWKWEFQINPANKEYIPIILAWDKDKLVGQYAAILRKFWINGSEKTGSLSLDTMTDPKYSKMGIFTKTAKALYDEMAKKGVSSVYGFPNANSIHGFVSKLGWKNISGFPPIYIRPIDIGKPVNSKLNSVWLGKLAHLFSIPINKSFEIIISSVVSNKGVEVRKEDSIGEWSEELWKRCRDQHHIWAMRNYEYMNWRYNLRPESKYSIFSSWYRGKIAGYIVTSTQHRAEGEVSFIMDIISDLNIKGSADALLKAVVQSSINKKDSMISAVLMPNSVYRSVLSRHLFLRLPKYLFPQEIYFGGRTFNDDIDQNVFFNPNSWHISWGDTDLM